VIIIQAEWKEFIDELLARKTQDVIYVIGRSDSGKTTFCKYLIESFLKDFSVAYIDCDPGQSTIGPPTTIGMAFYRNRYNIEDKEFLMFAGSTSPARHLLQNLTGIRVLLDKAWEMNPGKVVIDSSGFVVGDAAFEFQYNVIQTVRPDHLVIFQDEDELEGIARNFCKRAFPMIKRFKVPPSVKPRSMVERQLYREEKFRNYFKVVKEYSINLREIGIHGTVVSVNKVTLKNRLISLNDDEGLVLSLGIVIDYEKDSGTLSFFSPTLEINRVTSIQIGDIFLDPSGKEIRSA